MIKQTIKLLGIDISAIIPPEYIGQKIIEIGTGIVWEKLKNRLEGENNAVGAGLYDAIEHSVEAYAYTHNKDDIAICCEKLYFEWMQNNSLKDDSIKKALSKLSAEPIGEVQVETWKSFLDMEIIKNDELRNWIDHKSIANINPKLDYIIQKLDRMPETLKKCEIVENRYDIFNDSSYKIYIKNMYDAYRESVMGESFGLNKIYTDLHSIICDNIEHTEKKVKNVAEYICKWLKDKRCSNSMSMLLVYGEPGSGKSSVLKKVVDELTNSDEDKKTIVLALNLFEVTFVDAKTALDVVKQYIKNEYPWFYEADKRLGRILILDGLDEIKYKVYEKSQELLRELEGEKWKFDCKVVVSGRTQAVRKAKEKIDNYIDVEILPLYIDEDEREKYISKVVDEKNLLEIDLRLEYWDKLQKEFNIAQNMPLQNSRFDELSRQPLLLFLIMWTAKYSNIDLMELKNTAELYDKIFECIYTREYSRKKAGGLKYKAEYLEYQIMLEHLGGCAYRNNSRSVSAKTIYEYCTVMDDKKLCENWIKLHQDDNPSKLVLLFFLRENYKNSDDSKSTIDEQNTEIEFMHKTFYEYLAAIEIIRLMYEYTKSDDYDKKLKQVFYMFSQNRVDDVIVGFIKEIIQNENLMFGDEVITLAKYDSILSEIVCGAYNVNYPVMIGTGDLSQYIYVKNYQNLKNIVLTYEKSISELIKGTADFINISENNIYKLQLENMEWDDVNIALWVLDYCNMGGSRMENAILSGASFKYSDIQDAVLMMVTADRTDFSNATLDRTDFTNAYLAVANFSDVEMEETVFDITNIEGGYFNDSILTDVSFAGADLTAVNFDYATLTEVDFRSADLTRANMTGVTINDCKWEACIMEDAILADVDISSFNLEDEVIVKMLAQADLSEAIWDNVTEEQERRLFEEKKQYDSKMLEFDRKQ